MTRSSVSTFMRSFLRHCLARPAFVALMALALGGAVAGGALALSPTVDTGLVFRGGVNIVKSVGAGSFGHAITVPPGRKFMLTDLVIAGLSETSPAMLQEVYTGTEANCTTLVVFRTGFLNVPAGDTLHLPFVTGIGFTAGQHVCISNGDIADTTHWTIRGYLFE